MIIVLLAIVIAIIFIVKEYKKYKVIKVGNYVMITGGLKTGKSTLSVYLAKQQLNKRIKETKRHNFFAKIFIKWSEKTTKETKFSQWLEKWSIKEMPKLYSNVPLAIPYVPITEDLLLREKRFAYNSVVYLQEVSLIADSMSYKDKEMSDKLNLLVKLIAHETKGGCLILDTQSIADTHFAFKKSLTNNLYVHDCVNLWFLPFVIIHLTEERYSYDGTQEISKTAYSEDLSETLKTIVISKKTWKLFDRYTYSALTDGLQKVDKEIQAETLKTQVIFDLQKIIKERKQNAKKDD